MEGTGCIAVGGVGLKDSPGVLAQWAAESTIYSDGKMGGDAGALGVGRRCLWVPTGLPSGWVEEGQTLHAWQSGNISAADILFLVSSWVVFEMRG